MAKNKKPAKSGKDVQRTEKGLEIPVPKREDVLRDLKKAARTKPPLRKKS